jgi:DNA-binding transcriptional LysR family regulator
MRGIDLDDLSAFAVVARHRNFRAAARERGVSPSTLSQQVRDLEERLGTRLLHRTTRSVAPTETGSRLLDRLGPALSDIAAAVDQVHAAGGEPAGTLRINAPAPALELVIAPLVAPFLAAHPHVRLDLVGQTELVDIVEAGFDAGIRWGEHLAQDMVAVPFGGEQRFIVAAAPSLLARTGTPKEPADLLSLPCIRQLFPGGVRPLWEFEKDGKTVRIDPDGPLVSNNLALQTRAALDGVGFQATFEEYLSDHIAAGRLVSVLDDWCPKFPGPFLYYPSRRNLPTPLRAFVDFVKAARSG